MIERRLTKAEFEQSNNQADHLRILKRNVNILFYDYILQIPGSLGMKVYDGTLFDPEYNKIRVNNATYDHLLEWLKKGVEMLRKTPDHPIGNPNGQQTEMMIRIYDEGNTYF